MYTYSVVYSVFRSCCLILQHIIHTSKAIQQNEVVIALPMTCAPDIFTRISKFYVCEKIRRWIRELLETNFSFSP
jgi:hypothetical protein